MSEIYMDYHAVLGTADSIQSILSQLEAKREELESIRWRLWQKIEVDGEIESRLNSINNQMRALHGRMAGIPQFLNDAVDAYIAADHRVQSLGDALNRQTAPIIKSIMHPTATGAKKPKGGTESWWQKVGDFIYDHRKAIIIAAAAVVLIGVGIATCGAGDVVLAPALAAALGMGSIGAGTSMVGEEVSDYLDDGKVDNSYRSYAGTAAGGFVTGAVCPVGGAEAVTVKGVAIAAGKNAIGGMAGDALGQEISTGKIDAKQVIETGAVSGVLAGGATFLAGKLTGVHPMMNTEGVGNATEETFLNANPFKGKSAEEIDEMFTSKGFETRGPDPLNGKGGYVNPQNGRSYHIDFNNSFNEDPHIDVNRLRSYNGPLDKKKLYIW